MSKLIVKSIERAGKGLIVSEGVSVQVEVKRLAGCSSYTVFVDDVHLKYISRQTANNMWYWVQDYFGAWKIEEPTKPEKKTKIKVDTVK